MLLSIVNTDAQTIAAGGVVQFTADRLGDIPHNTASVTLPKGSYLITFDGDVTPVAGGVTTVQLYNNNVVVDGAQATFTGTAATTQHVSFSTIVEVLPSCRAIINKGIIQIKGSVAMMITNANLTIVKIGG